MSNTEPIQCPNCGHYDVHNVSWSCIDIALLIVTLGWWLLIMMIRNRVVKSGEKLHCNHCHYTWIHDPIPILEHDKIESTKNRTLNKYIKIAAFMIILYLSFKFCSASLPNFLIRQYLPLTNENEIIPQETEPSPEKAEASSQEIITETNDDNITSNNQNLSHICQIDESILLHNDSFELSVSEIEIDQTNVIIILELTSKINAWWSNDLERVSEIYLETPDGSRFEVQEMRGIPAEDVGSAEDFSFIEGTTKTGSIVFAKPPATSFTFHYLDRDSTGPIEISLQDYNCE